MQKSIEEWAKFFKVSVLKHPVTNRTSALFGWFEYNRPQSVQKDKEDYEVWHQVGIRETEIFISLQNQINNLRDEVYQLKNEISRLHNKIPRQER